MPGLSRPLPADAFLREETYARTRLPVSLVYVEECDSLSAALKRERQLKPWSRPRKEALIAGDRQALKRA